MDGIIIVIKDMPSGLKGCVSSNADGSYTIFINARLNLEQQQEVYLHELRHILNDDFCKFDVDTVEFNNIECSSREFIINSLIRRYCI